MQKEIAVIDGGVASHIHHNVVRLKFPLGVRQFARGDAAVVHHVMIGAGFFDQLSSEREGSRRGENDTVAAEAQSRRCGHIVKASSLGSDVVIPVTRLDVVIIRAAVYREMSRGSGLTGIRVVGQVVGTQDVIPVVDLDVAVKFVDVPVFFLLESRRSWSSRNPARLPEWHMASFLPDWFSAL